MKQRKRPLYGFGFKTILSLLGALLSVSCCCSAKSNSSMDGDTCETTQKTRKVLPSKTIIKHIDKSTEVKFYTINSLYEDSLAEKLCGFCVVDTSKVLSSEQVKRLKQIIANDSNYIRKDDVVKFSTFIPDYAFKFIDGKDSVVLFLDFHADIWSFRYKKKEFISDNEKPSPALRNLIENIFGKKLENPQPRNTVSSNKINGSVILANDTEIIERKDSVKEEKQESIQQYVKLSSKIQNMITDSDSVSCVILDPLTKEKTDNHFLGKYAILMQKSITDKGVNDSLKQLLLADKSFPKFDFAKNCTFLPDIAFVFYCNNETLNVLFSFYCDECRMIISNKLEFSNDCSNIRSEIITISRNVFPKDKYLRTISK